MPQAGAVVTIETDARGRRGFSVRSKQPGRAPAIAVCDGWSDWAPVRCRRGKADAQAKNMGNVPMFSAQAKNMGNVPMFSSGDDMTNRHGYDFFGDAGAGGASGAAGSWIVIVVVFVLGFCGRRPITTTAAG